MSWFTKFAPGTKQYGCDKDDFDYRCEHCGKTLDRVNNRWECPIHKEKWY